MTAAEIASLVLVRLEWAILVYFLLVNGWYMLLLFSAGDRDARVRACSRAAGPAGG